VKDRDKTPRIIPFDHYHVVSERQVDHDAKVWLVSSGWSLICWETSHRRRLDWAISSRKSIFPDLFWHSRLIGRKNKEKIVRLDLVWLRAVSD
jgi:hypothetical protein